MDKKMQNNEKEYELIKRYARSVFFDQATTVGFLFVLFVCLESVSSLNVMFIAIFVFPLLFVWFTISDYILNGASVGKRIYKVQLKSKDPKNKLSLQATIQRRMMEAFLISPIFKKVNNIESSHTIDRLTHTHIVNHKKPKTFKKRNDH